MTVDTSPGTLGTNDGAGGGSDGCPAAPGGCRPHNIQSTGFRTIHHVIEPYVVRGDEARIRERGVSIIRGASYFAGSPGSPRCTLFGCNGLVVTAGGPGAPGPLPSRLVTTACSVLSASRI